MSLRSVVPLALFVASSVGLSTVGLATSSASTSKSSKRTFKSKSIAFGIADQQDIGLPEMYDNADFKALKFENTRMYIPWDEIPSGKTGTELRNSCIESWKHHKHPLVTLESHRGDASKNIDSKPPLNTKDWYRAFKLVDMCNSPAGTFKGYADIEIANEPDHPDTKMTPHQAVQGLKVARSLYKNKARISPFGLAMVRGARSWQSGWITSWKYANYPAIDAIGYHPYGDTNSDKSSLVPLVTSFAEQWNHRPRSKRGSIPEVWLTEFSVWHSQQEPCYGSSVIDDNGGSFWVIPKAFQYMQKQSTVAAKLEVASAYRCYKLTNNGLKGKKKKFTLQAPSRSVESSKAKRYVKMVNYWANLKWPGSKTKWLHRVYWYEWANARCTRPENPKFFGPIGAQSPSQVQGGDENGYAKGSKGNGGCGDDNHFFWQSGFYGYSSNSQYFEPSPITDIIKAARP